MAQNKQNKSEFGCAHRAYTEGLVFTLCLHFAKRVTFTFLNPDSGRTDTMASW